MSPIFNCIVCDVKKVSNTLDPYQTSDFNVNFASVQTTIKMSLVFLFIIYI